MTDGLHLPGSFDRVSADDVGGLKVPRVKVVSGSDGVANDAGGGAPLNTLDEYAPLILRELRILNLHLAKMSDEYFTAENVEG